jgi:hypothetical protein
MANSATQNPSNKVGRNSGAGAGGISEIVPSEREAQQGLQPLRTSHYEEPSRSYLGLGTVAVLGAGVATFVMRRLRQPQSRIDRVRSWVGLKPSGLDRVRRAVGLKQRRRDRVRSWVGLK